MLVRHATTLDLPPKRIKAWSQKLGHADVPTTFTSYGRSLGTPKGELVRAARERLAGLLGNRELMAIVASRLADRDGGLSGDQTNR